MARLALILLLAGCSPDVGRPAWAMDTTRLIPVDGTADVTGLQSFALFDALFEEHQSPKRFVCTVLVTFDGTPSAEPCEGCAASWDTTAQIQEEDCPKGALADLDFFDAIQSVGIGPVPRKIDVQLPHAEAQGSWVRYPDTGWTGHGWAWRAGLLEDAIEPGPWNGKLEFDLVAAVAWDLSSPFATTEPVAAGE